MTNNIFILFVSNDQFKVTGIEGVKGFRFVNRVYAWIVLDEFGKGSYAINPKVMINVFYAFDDICSYQGVASGTKAINYG